VHLYLIPCYFFWQKIEVIDEIEAIEIIEEKSTYIPLLQRGNLKRDFEILLFLKILSYSLKISEFGF
jgi:hypothetical protein